MNQVSCVIPFYNGGDTIARAIDSAIGSAFCLEVIVVSDGSPQALDASLTAAHRAYIEAGKLRLVLLESNHGQGAARNIGSAVSRGAYLAFLDQDDMYLPGFQEVAVRFLDDHPHLAAVEVGVEIVQDGRIVLDESDPRYFTAINSAPWNIVLRRNAFWSCGGFPVGPEFRTENAGEDIAFKSMLRHVFVGVSFTDKLVRHHIRTNSATDRYLKGTKIVDGAIVATAANFANDNMGDAQQAHSQRVLAALRAERAITLNLDRLSN